MAGMEVGSLRHGYMATISCLAYGIAPVEGSIFAMRPRVTLHSYGLQ